MSIPSSRDVVLNKRLKRVLEEQNLEKYQTYILSLSEQLGVSVLESAAALLYENKVNLGCYSATGKMDKNEEKKPALSIIKPKQKLVRYRLDVGRKHQVLLEEMKTILVDVSGVERSQIGRIDIRNHYTLVDLPHGMPADIFQLLSETMVDQQKFNIKRIKQHRKFNHQQKKIKKRFSS